MDNGDFGGDVFVARQFGTCLFKSDSGTISTTGPGVNFNGNFYAILINKFPINNGPRLICMKWAMSEEAFYKSGFGKLHKSIHQTYSGNVGVLTPGHNNDKSFCKSLENA